MNDCRWIEEDDDSWRVFVGRENTKKLPKRVCTGKVVFKNARARRWCGLGTSYGGVNRQALPQTRIKLSQRAKEKAWLSQLFTSDLRYFTWLGLFLLHTGSSRLFRTGVESLVTPLTRRTVSPFTLSHVIQLLIPVWFMPSPVPQVFLLLHEKHKNYNPTNKEYHQSF